MSEEITKIKLKRGIGSPSSLEEGEPAIDLETGDLYIGIKNNQIKRIPNIEEINEKISDIDSASQEDMESLIIKMERLQYYENTDVIPTDKKYFIVSEDGAISKNTECIDELKEIVIPYEVDGITITKIAREGFDGCANLVNVILPNSIISIDNYGFWGCSFDIIDIPQNCSAIGSGAFGECINLKSIILPKGLTKLQGSLFYKCANLERVYLPDTITFIDSSSFDGCSDKFKIVCCAGSTTEKLVKFSGYPYVYDVIEGYTKAETDVMITNTQPKDLIIPLTANEDGTLSTTVENVYSVIMEAVNEGRNVYVSGDYFGNNLIIQLSNISREIFFFKYQDGSEVAINADNEIVLIETYYLTEDILVDDFDDSGSVDVVPTTAAVADYVTSKTTTTLTSANAYTDTKIGEIDTVLDKIIALQNSYIGGDAE